MDSQNIVAKLVAVRGIQDLNLTRRHHEARDKSIKYLETEVIPYLGLYELPYILDCNHDILTQRYVEKYLTDAGYCVEFKLSMIRIWLPDRDFLN